MIKLEDLMSYLEVLDNDQLKAIELAVNVEFNMRRLNSRMEKINGKTKAESQDNSGNQG